MVDKGSVQRRPLDFEDYTDIVRRNIRWILAPMLAGLVVSTVVAYSLQDKYISHALIRLVPQQISGDLVQNTSAQDMTDRISGLAQDILSRTTLTNLIQTYGLYKPELKSEPLEDVINKMHSAIGIHPTVGVNNMQGKGMAAMEISFEYRNGSVANKVCGDLVSRFMNASTAGSIDAQIQGNAFLKDEMDKAKADLDRLEKELADYRTAHAGTLPDQMAANFQQMSAAQQRLNSLSDAASRLNERRMGLESALRISQDHLAAIRSIVPVSVAHTEKNAELDRQISDLETNVASLKERYTDENPDMQAAQERLAVLKRERDNANKATAANKTPDAESPTAARERIDAQSQIESIKAQLKATDVEDQQINRQIQEANGQLRTLQARLEGSPANEREYADLIRDREVAKMKFLDADNKMHKSNVSMDLERRKQGETLEVIDNPSMPTDPTEPKRAIIIPIGAVGGLVLGIILVAIREIKDASLKNLKDARVYTQLSILGSIPLLENDVVVQRRKQVMLVSWAAATVLGIAIIVGSVAHYYLNKA